MGLFTVLTLAAGIATFTPRSASKGDLRNNLVHTVAFNNVARAAAQTVERQSQERREARAAATRNIRWGSTHTYSSNNRYGGGSYRGGK